MKTITRTQVGKSVLHRTGLTAIDKLAVPASPTGVDVTTGGSLAFSTTYNFTVAAATDFGPTTVPANGSVATAADAANTHVVRITLAQVVNAQFYDIFLSTGANPLWVARITEAQRAAGVTITAVGTVSATSPGAGLVDVRVVGTGLASNVAPFSANNAFVVAGVVPVDCTGFTTATLYVLVSTTDLRSLPTFSYTAFRSPVNFPDNYAATASLALSPLSAVRTPLRQVGTVTVNGTSQLIVLCDAITGQGASAEIYVDLS